MLKVCGACGREFEAPVEDAACPYCATAEIATQMPDGEGASLPDDAGPRDGSGAQAEPGSLGPVAADALSEGAREAAAGAARSPGAGTAPASGEHEREHEPPRPAPVERTGVAWERRSEVGLLLGLVRTIGEFLARPAEAGRRMRLGEGIGDPLLFALLIGAVTSLVSFAYVGASLLAGIGPLVEQLALPQRETLRSLTLGSVFLAAAAAPVVLVVWLFVVSVLLHVSALLVGADAGGYEGTFRALAYGAGSASVLAVMPVCGAPIALIWGFVAIAGALSGAHGVSGGRAAAAAVLPFVAFCCGCGGISALVVALGAAGSAGS